MEELWVKIPNLKMIIKRGLGIRTNTSIKKIDLIEKNIFQTKGNFKEIFDKTYLKNNESEKNNFKTVHFQNSQFKTYEIMGDFELNQEIKNSTQVILLIRNNSKVRIISRGKSNNFLSSGIHFFVDKKVNLEIYLDYELSGEQNYITVNLDLEKDSLVKLSSNIKSYLQTMAFFKTNLKGEGAEIDKRLFLDSKDSDVDFELLINQNNKKTKSNIMVNGILENSKIINHNTIKIPSKSLETQGYEYSKFLLLDNNSNVISIPNLEIATGDVVCSHGSVISQISEDELFYLQSRGLKKDEVINLIKNGLKEKVFSHLSTKLNSFSVEE